ncbi:hypothetical protein AHF37_08647 [Paragonimus kellicotti]|nr:hypothetical protein AHF37_08647 [Paragonimus kellicotti]
MKPGGVDARAIRTVSSKQPRSKAQCPLHGKTSNLKGCELGERTKNSPASVTLKISSPVLSDDDSGFEVNGLNEYFPRYTYLPPSPALCTCSDLEEEETSELTVFTSTPIEKFASSGMQKSVESHITSNAKTKCCRFQKSVSNRKTEFVCPSKQTFRRTVSGVVCCLNTAKQSGSRLFTMRVMEAFQTANGVQTIAALISGNPETPDAASTAIQ